ncbi:hypothetical protein MLD38_012130 [Melastoma candidum]|uniref:Uncharacterized protein n=1 Tax=Melastoma candidum TaxID=119954 RepID=A0ACB9RDR8_9MYRT|nr:hypothetical protein MLD38_012130 [Melastoma candidum]
MEVVEQKQGEGKAWGFLRLPFRVSSNSRSGNDGGLAYMGHHYNQQHHLHNQYYQGGGHGQHPEGSAAAALHGSRAASVSSVAKSLVPARRRLKLDPPAKLYFPYEPGKQVRSAMKIKNISKSHVAFKFQTTAPKSCFMRPPGAVLAPGESIIATVFKFVEHPENNEKPMSQKSKVKFRIMCLKVKGQTEYVPELFDEQRDQVVVEQILRVIFLDPERPNPAMDKLKHQLADADAAVEARKQPPEDTGPGIIGEGLVIDEWKERRERYLARQQGEGELL